MSEVHDVRGLLELAANGEVGPAPITELLGRGTRRRRTWQAASVAVTTALTVVIILVVAALTGQTTARPNRQPIPARTPPSQPVVLPVLGWDRFFPHYDKASGWGDIEPKFVSNQGDPASTMSNLRWRGWGSNEALAVGTTAAAKEPYGYYKRQVKVELRASDLGLCHGKLAYLRLQIRGAAKPGGRVGKRWFPWIGKRGNICGSFFAGPQ